MISESTRNVLVGRDLENEGKKEEAIGMYEKAINLYIEEGLPNAAVNLCLRKFNDKKRAINIYYLNGLPHNAAQLARHLGEEERAIEIYDELIKKEKDPLSHLRLCQERGINLENEIVLYDEVISHYEKIKDFDTADVLREQKITTSTRGIWNQLCEYVGAYLKDKIDIIKISDLEFKVNSIREKLFSKSEMKSTLVVTALSETNNMQYLTLERMPEDVLSLKEIIKSFSSATEKYRKEYCHNKAVDFFIGLVKGVEMKIQSLPLLQSNLDYKEVKGNSYKIGDVFTE